MGNFATLNINAIERRPEIDGNGSRLSYWLEREEESRNRKKLFRRESHEYEAAIMRRPVAIKDAFGQFGLLLGTLPPAAIFYLFSTEVLRLHQAPSAVFFVSLFLLMNVVCAVVGRAMGRVLSESSLFSERKSWTFMLLLMPIIGLAWGLVTGFFGGLLFFGIGGFFGMAIAAPIGALAFTVFAILHRILERGGQIERRHFLPVAYGISLAFAAFFLGL